MSQTTPRKSLFTIQGRVSQAQSFIHSLADPERFSYAFLAKQSRWTERSKISQITQSNPAIVTSYGHSFVSGDLCEISGVVGMTQINGFGGVPLVIGTVTADTFQILGCDSTLFSTYVSGGFAAKILESEWPDPQPVIGDSDTARREMIVAKRISASDACHVIPRNDWVAGTVYASADYSDPALEDKKFHVYTASGRVYKCIWNNGGSVSTVVPNSTSLATFTTADGYIWKFMFEISYSDAAKFLSSAWVPVRTLLQDDGSIQWDVQNAAVPGTIDAVTVLARGTLYGTNTTFTVEGDGIGAVAQVAPVAGIGTGGELLKVFMSDRGRNYSRATIFANHATGTRAKLKTLVSNCNGHGADAVNELLARHVMIATPIVGDESGKAFVDTAFRRSGILVAPRDSTGKPATATVYDCRTTLVSVAATAPFAVDEIVTGSNGSVGRVQSVSGSTVKIVDVTGTFAQGDVVTGTSGSITVLSVTTPLINLSTGLVAYLEHRGATTRRPSRTEVFRVVIEF